MRQVGYPVVPDVFVNPLGQQWVAMVEEPSLGNAVGLVVELLREHQIEIMQLLVLEDLGMQPGHAVD